MRLVFLSVAMAVILAGSAEAGAWPYDKGRGQLIASLESVTAQAAYDTDGQLSVPLDVYSQTDLSLYAQYGLTERLTLTAKSGYQTYDTESERFSGLPAIEVGLRYNIVRTRDSVFSVAVSVEGLGEGKRSDYDISGNSGTDTELRALYGRNVRLAGYPGFINIEGAYRQRSSGPDQQRLDATVGVKFERGWMALAQVFAGQTQKETYDFRGQWVNAQVSIAKTLGDNTVQIGWRKMMSGRAVPDKNTLIIGLWRDF